MAETRYRSVKQIAETYDITRETVLRWIKDGQLKAMRVGGQYRISTANWEAFTKQQDSAAS